MKKNIVTIALIALLTACTSSPIEDYPYEETDIQEVERNPHPKQSIEVNHSTAALIEKGPEICQNIGSMIFKSLQYVQGSSNQFSCIYHAYEPIARTLTPPDYITVSYKFDISPGTYGKTRVTGIKVSNYMNRYGRLLLTEEAKTKPDLLVLRRILAEFK